MANYTQYNIIQYADEDGIETLGHKDRPHYVTLTFYVEYGNDRHLEDLLDTLQEYNVKKAIFFVQKDFAGGSSLHNNNNAKHRLSNLSVVSH